jgi:hypothetical protein
MGHAERGIFWGQELAGTDTIITRIRLPVGAKEEPHLGTAGEAHATDLTREI